MAYVDVLDIFPAARIPFWSVAHDENAAHMADGYSRASRRHGVCIAKNGPGIMNFATAIAAAYWAQSPVVAITPETESMTIGQGGFQETEQLPIVPKVIRYRTHRTGRDGWPNQLTAPSSSPTSRGGRPS